MAAISGQKTVTTAGTEVALGSLRVNGPVAVKALASNTGYMYVGNAGDATVASTTGFQLAADEVILLGYVGDLSTIMVDSSVNGEKVCWLALEVM